MTSSSNKMALSSLLRLSFFLSLLFLFSFYAIFFLHGLFKLLYQLICLYQTMRMVIKRDCTYGNPCYDTDNCYYIFSHPATSPVSSVHSLTVIVFLSSCVLILYAIYHFTFCHAALFSCTIISCNVRITCPAVFKIQHSI